MVTVSTVHLKFYYEILGFTNNEAVLDPIKDKQLQGEKFENYAVEKKIMQIGV